MRFLETYFIWFMVYSVIGWIWEVIICSVPAKKFINRGFLNGPYCPIYGFGAVLVAVLLRDIDNPILIFLAGALLTCTLEYITSWVMEKLFHARWWDYSDKFLNINGRVCLIGAVAFGSLSVVVLKLIQPFLEEHTNRLPELACSLIALILFTVIIIDAVFTVTKIYDLNEKLHELSERINDTLVSNGQQRQSIKNKLQESEFLARLSEIDLRKRFNSQERRMMKSFPKFRSSKYDEALQRIKQHILRKGDSDK